MFRGTEKKIEIKFYTLNNMAKFLKDAKGNDSSNRLIFVIGSLWVMAMTTYLGFKGIEVPILIAFYSGIQAVLIGLKLGQMPLERDK